MNVKVRNTLLCCCALSALISFCRMATYTGAGTVNAASPDVEDEFLLGSWLSFYDVNKVSYEKQLEDLARSGINWQPNPTYLSNGLNDDVNYTPAQLNEIYKKYNSYFTAHKADDWSFYTPMAEQARALMKECENLSNCNAYYVKDEPSAAEFESVKKVFNEFLKDNKRFPWVGLYPNYAGATNLGGSYNDYVENWVNTIGKDNLEYLSYDHYPFTAFEDVRSTFFSDLETIRRVAYDNNRMKTMACTQLGHWNGMRRPTIDEARWDNNVFLAYGMKSIIHFCWVALAYISPENGGEGMQPFVLTSSGEKTDLYEPMQKINWKTRQLGQLLMKMDVAHAYHTGKIAQGAESLPKSFIFQPSSSSDKLIFSLAYSKDDNDVYVMVFNNETKGEPKKYTINVDLSSGVQSITRYETDDFEVLPDYMQKLPDVKESNLNIKDGSFSIEMKPGDIAVYKLNGDVIIKEPLQVPCVSHKSGTYLGEQYVELSTNDAGAEIYYTTDGSYPSYHSELYKKPVKIGNGREFGIYGIKAISIRGDEVSDAVNAEYVISDGSENVAFKKPVKFTGETTSMQGVSYPESVNDGFFDPFNPWSSVDKSPCWAIIDLEDIYTVDKAIIKAWHDWHFGDVVVQTALDENFTKGVYTIFNNDSDNSVGAGIGTDGEYIENPSGGHCFRFQPVKARYIRVTNCTIENALRRSVWEEIQLYSSYVGGVNLSSENEWEVTGGGDWVHDGDTIRQNGEHDHDHWSRSYTYKAKKFKNFILEGKFTMSGIDPSAWGYVGFGLYKPEIYNTQNDYDKGYYVGVEPRGRVLLWNGAKPELGPTDANIVGFSCSSEFDLRVVSVDDTISVSVNGQPVMYTRASVFNREAGYISIHSGLVPVSVNSVCITELSDEVRPFYNEECIKSGGTEKMAVPRYTKKHEVLEMLPSEMAFMTVSGKTMNCGVKWTCDNYNCAKTGYISFMGEFVDLPEGYINPYNVMAKIDVFIQPELDLSEINKLIELADSLDPNNYTEESYNGVVLKRDAAVAMINNPYLSQSDIGVGLFQLYDAIYINLESVVDRTEIKNAINEAEAILEKNNYTQVSRQKIESEIERAKRVSEDILSDKAQITQVKSSLKQAVESGIILSGIKLPYEKPQISENNDFKNKGCNSSADGLASAAGMLVAAVAAMLMKKRISQAKGKKRYFVFI